MFQTSTIIASLLWLAALSSSSHADDTPVSVAAAASLRQAWSALQAANEAAVSAPRISFSSSGNLYRQIRQGAPFDLFLSANAEFPTQLQRAGLTAQPPVTFAHGELELVMASESDFALIARQQLTDGAGTAQSPLTESELDRILALPELAALTLANPEHAPYGTAAANLLSDTGLALQKLQEQGVRVALAENAAQALHYIQSGAASVGLIPRSLLQGSAAPAGLDRYALSAAPGHRVRHTLVLLNNASSAARQWAEYLLSEEAATVLQSFGFAADGDGTMTPSR